MKRKIILLWSLVILLFILAAFTGCGSQKGGNDQKAENAAKEEQEEGKEEQDAKEEQEEQKEPKEPASEEMKGLAAPSVTGALHVEGTQLTGENGEPVQLKGISTHGMAWFPDYINEACFENLHEEWKANLIRLAMYTAESGGYCTDGDKEYLKGLVRDGVEYARRQDMYAIIDWHILTDTNPNTYLNEAKDFFKEMSAEYADADHVLYEICNEPNGNTSWSEIKAYAEEVIPVIRENDENAVIIVGTPNWSQFVDQAAADPITEYENVMYTLHFYAATHKEDLRNKMAAAIEGGLPIFVTEYGICDASGNGAIDEEQANRWVELMDQYGVSYAAWNLSNKDESSAIFQSSCTKTSGFTEDDLSASGKWLYHMLNAGYRQDMGSEEAADEENGQEDNKPRETKGNAGEAGTAENGSVTLSSGDIEITAFVKNQWEEDGVQVYQYELTLKNTSGQDCAGWSIDIPFQDAVTLKDGWNGEYTVQEDTLHITSKDYNGSISPGDSIGDIGFIISGGRGIRDVTGN